MINRAISYTKKWYKLRQKRERILILALTWIFLYAIFYLILFRSADKQKDILLNNIKEVSNQINNWNTQITTLKKISDSPLYKKWLSKNKSFKNLQEQYKYLLKTSPNNQWQDVIKTILHTQKNITLVQIKNYPEIPYHPTALSTLSTKVYEQRLLMVIYSNFFDTVNYIQQLEKTLPNIHWNNLHYQVVQYPVAKVDMEFSIFYEKNS